MEHTMHVDAAIAARHEPAPDCSMARALEVVSTRSAMLLMREALYGVTRFDDFVARAGVSEPVCAARLKELVAAGLLVREPYRETGQRTRWAYRLTEQGSELAPALLALMRWGDRWLTEAGGPVALTHHGCGAPVHAEIRCTAGHSVAPAEIDVAATAEGRRLRAARRKRSASVRAARDPAGS